MPAELYPLAYPAFDDEPRREPALQITHASGTTSTRLRVDDVERTDHGDGRLDHAIHLVDEAEPLGVTLRVRAWTDHGVVEQWTEVENRQRGRITIHAAAAAAPSFLAGDSRLTHFAGDWASEWSATDELLTLGTKVLESRGGIRPHLQRSPYLLLSPEGPSTEDEGLVLAAAIQWGGDLRVAFERTATRQLRMFAGHNHAVGPYVLDPGRTFTSPAVAWTWSSAGRRPLSHALHRWIRATVVRDGHRRRACVVNNWESTSFDFDEARIVGLIEAGAAIGGELFLLDDGWFGVEHPRDDDTTGLGDWVPDPRKLPAGLGPLAGAAEANGMRFGLWVEPEMVNPASTLYEEHPDWVVAQPGRHRRTERNQLVLDVLQPEVRAHLLDTIDHVLAENPGISYLKWDANRFISEPGSPTLAADRQANLWVDSARATADVMAEVARRHPDVELMLCSSGGGRIDLATLRSFHEVWLSDNTDPVTRVRMQYVASHFLPAGVLGAHVTSWGGRPVPFACAVALSGRFGFDLDLTALDDDDLAACRRAVEVHGEIGDLVQQGDVWRLLPPDEGGASAIAFADPTSRRAVAFCFQLGERVPDAGLPTPFLDAGRRYAVRTTDLTTPLVAVDDGWRATDWPLHQPCTALLVAFDPV